MTFYLKKNVKFTYFQLFQNEVKKPCNITIFKFKS